VPDELEGWFRDRGEPTYRARQVADAVWRGTAAAATEIRTLPEPLRGEVDASFTFDTVADTEIRLADG
jgi:adenine C2-methylase RlmN of 23S rRNA A2503 and tRNA A37